MIAVKGFLRAPSAATILLVFVRRAQLWSKGQLGQLILTPPCQHFLWEETGAPEHRVNTYRDITSAPTFFVRMLGKLLEFTGIEYTIQDGGSPFNYRGNLPSMRSWSFFARPREKKWVHENVTFPSSVIPLYDLSSVI